MVIWYTRLYRKSKNSIANFRICLPPLESFPLFPCLQKSFLWKTGQCKTRKFALSAVDSTVSPFCSRLPRTPGSYFCWPYIRFAFEGLVRPFNLTTYLSGCVLIYYWEIFFWSLLLVLFQDALVAAYPTAPSDEKNHFARSELSYFLWPDTDSLVMKTRNHTEHYQNQQLLRLLI